VVVAVDIPASESGLARSWRPVDENQSCDPASLLTALAESRTMRPDLAQDERLSQIAGMRSRS